MKHVMDLTGVEHHSAVSEIVEVLCHKTQNSDNSFFKATLAFFFGMMASKQRVSLVTQNRGEIPVNIYSLGLATSGFGKGYSVGIIESELMHGFRKRFMGDTFQVLAERNLNKIANVRAARNGTNQQEEIDNAMAEFRRAGQYLFSFDSGTTPAVKQMRGKLLLANAGSINLQIDEIGSNLIGNTEVLNAYLELYDQGIIKQKLVKETAESKRGEDIEGKTPANMLLFGTPANLFDGSQVEAQFNQFLEIGYARRCLFGLGIKDDSDFLEKTPEELFEMEKEAQKSPNLKKWSRHFQDLADPKMFGWKIKVPEDVSIKLLEYMQACKAASHKLPDNKVTQKAELEHRYFKALKLAGAYAFIDKSSDVDMDHLLSAILLVEESGEAFEALNNREKPYEKLAKYIATAEEDPGYSQAELVDALSFYKGSQSMRNEQMALAQSFGYKNNIIIKKSFIDGIEFFKGETLEETDLDKLILSYSDHWAYNYNNDYGQFNNLHLLTQNAGLHWTNHHFEPGMNDSPHREESRVIPGFNTVVIDVDEGVSLDQAHELLSDYTFMTYTTKRHTKEQNRFRLIIPINYTLKLSKKEYREFMDSFMEFLPFPSDEAANQRSKKWESFEGGSYKYNRGDLFDALKFVPKTSRADAHRKEFQSLQSLDNLERWFAQRIAQGSRNNQMIKFALALVDTGLTKDEVERAVVAFNAKLDNPLREDEISNTIMVTVAKRFSEGA